MESTELINSDNHWMLWGILFSVTAFGFWAERTKWGSKLSGMMITLLGTFILSNLSIIPNDAPVYDVIWTYFVPLAIPLLLMKANLKRIIKEAGPTLIAFLFGAVGTVLGTLSAFYLINLGEDSWRLAGIFAATYIGGTMNYMAAAEVLQLKSGTMLTAGLAADNLIMTIYFFLLFALPSIGFIANKFVKRENLIQVSEEINTSDERKSDSLLDLSKAISISFVICAIGFGSAEFFGFKGGGVLILTGLTVVLATIFHSFFSSIKGSETPGLLLMQVFFAAIGASANIKTVIEVGPLLFVFAAIILAIHLITILIAGKIFKLDLREIIIASNANIGGPTTSAAMAAARKWDDLVLPAILCGTLGYSIATFIGSALGYWLK